MGTLVPLDTFRFPAIPGAKVPERPKYAWRVDYGPDFLSKRIVSKDPPEIGSRFPVLLPQVGEDGNEISGIRLPVIETPLATLTGWNLRDASIGAPTEIFSMTGSYFPFPLAKAAGDPRKPIPSLYSGKQDYLGKVRQAAADLAGQGYLLKRDIDRIAERAAAEWDFVHAR